MSQSGYNRVDKRYRGWKNYERTCANCGEKYQENNVQSRSKYCQSCRENIERKEDVIV